MKDKHEPNIKDSLVSAVKELDRRSREEREFTLKFSDQLPGETNLDCDVIAGGNPGVVVAPSESILVIEKRAYDRLNDALQYSKGVLGAWMNGDETAPTYTTAICEIERIRRGELSNDSTIDSSELQGSHKNTGVWTKT